MRVAVPGIPDADALPAIVAGAGLPIIADIHFNASLALRAMDTGVAAVRINPGNIGGPDKVEAVVRKAQATGTPLRIGANSGSLPDHLRPMATADPAGALVAAAMEEVELLERLDFRDFKISVKSSSVPAMIEAYRRLAAQVPYPLHLGVTEAGLPGAGTVKSAIGIGTLLADGIGDTIRVSLTADPGRGARPGVRDPARRSGCARPGPNLIACPSCGRTNVEVHELAGEVDERLSAYSQHFEVAVMGCAVNGPGEAGNADFGIAGGRDSGLHLRARRGAAQGAAGAARGRALPRDRRLDRARHAAPGARPRDARDRRGGRVIVRLVKLGTVVVLVRRARRAPGRRGARAHRRPRFAKRREAGRWHDVPPPEASE